MNICIIGAGPTGLTAGYELMKRGHRIALYEREAEHGRLVRTTHIGSTKLERFYHHIFTTDLDIIHLIDELGLSAELSWLSPKNGMYVNNTLYPLSSPQDLLLFKELCPVERLSLGMFLLSARVTKKWEKIEDLTAQEWVVKQAGEPVYQKIWAPLLHSKFDRDAERVSAAWLWNRIKLRSATRSKTLISELLGYLNGSFMTIYDALLSYIVAHGGTIECSQEVRQITPQRDGSLEVRSGNRTENFEAVIITSLPALREITIPLPAWYREKIKKITFKANICMILELRERLSPYYWIAVAEKNSPFVAVIEHTNLVPGDNYNCHVVYLSRYLDETHELFLSSDEEVKNQFIRYLKRSFPPWDESMLIRTHLHRARYVQPVIFTGYSKIVPECNTPIRNLYLATMAQIYPEDRGQNYAIRMGKKIARNVDGK